MGMISTAQDMILSMLGKNNPQIAQALGGYIQENGGLEGIIANFKEKGLKDAVDSWVSTGKNISVTPEQVQSVLGNEKLAAIASKLGLNSTDVSRQISENLPKLIDKLTPNGHLPNTDGLIAKGADLLNTLKK